MSKQVCFFIGHRDTPEARLFKKIPDGCTQNFHSMSPPPLALTYACGFISPDPMRMASGPGTILGGDSSVPRGPAPGPH